MHHGCIPEFGGIPFCFRLNPPVVEYVVTKNDDDTYSVEVFYDVKGSVSEKDELQLVVR